MGKERDGGLRKLREELEAENSGVRITAEIRWLGGAKVRARFQEKKEGASSVVAAVLGEAVSTASADTESGSSEPSTVLMPMRRCDQTFSVLAAVDGGILLHTVWLLTPSALSVQEITKRPTTGAQLRGARWEWATHVLMEW